ncbi:uncharacterized protein RSE6_11926 [Rhynchosporium secalis]|uniref:Uncharacterized protein n=1 Tax=Rhynchosporium secalis TaxID=38038 RepID=A0A1E1MP48_RHYSE|nr:uncharacterized protein RSE6_11926 [Rhynchosporium secalis]
MHVELAIDIMPAASPLSLEEDSVNVIDVDEDDDVDSLAGGMHKDPAIAGSGVNG